MNEHPQLRIAREIFTTFDTTGSVEPILAAIADDVVLRLTVQPGTPLSGEFRGRAGVLEYFARLPDVVGLADSHTTHYLTGEDQVAAFGHETLHVKRSGQVCLDSRWTTLLTFRGEKIIGILIIEDTGPISAAYPLTTAAPATVG